MMGVSRMIEDPSTAVAAAVLAVVYVGLGILLIGRWRQSEGEPLSKLIIYMGLGASWSLGLGLKYAITAEPWTGLLGGMLMTYAMMVMPVAFLITTLDFLRLKQARASWWLWGTGLAVAAAILDPELDSLVSDFRRQLGPFTISAEQGVQAVSLIAWLLFLGTALQFTLREYGRTLRPLHRNRLRYWLLATSLVMLGYALAIARTVTSLELSAAVRLAAALTMTYAMLNFHPPDIKFIYRRTLSYSMITIVILFIYMLTIFAAQVALLNSLEAYRTMIGAAVVGLALAVLYQPLRQVTQHFVDRVILGQAIDYDQVLRDYSQHISQILDLERLAFTVLSTVEEVLGVTRGALVLAEEKPEGGLVLRPIHSLKSERLEELSCGPESLVAWRFRRERQPLSQYDVDVLPAFKALDPDERESLSRWNMEVFVPIGAKNELSGILALGRKASGDPYQEQDLHLLRSLADQTAVALQNARLFADLKALNAEMAQLNAELEQANLRLQELDRLKSDFLSVITHELRSPFVSLDLSLQIIRRYGTENFSAEQREQLETLENGLKEAERMIDTLIAFASLLSKKGVLQWEPIEFGQLVRDTIEPLKTIARSRQVDLIVNIPDTMPLIQGDRQLLAKAIHQLVHNAIKFNRPNGQAKVTCRQANEHVVFEVVDTGEGIPDDKLKNLWEEFSQVADPLRRGVEGLGLGLPLVKYVVNAHNGDVWALSEVGAGSTFGFRLPIERPTGELKKEPQANH
jgi:signal transduction histidine kinase